MTDAGKTAIYCRVALTNDIAIARQEKQLREYAKEHGHAETVSFRDNGFPGNTLNRPALYAHLLLSERLFPHLREVDEAAAHRLAAVKDRLQAEETINELIYE
jgi:hypothetical protein